MQPWMRRHWPWIVLVIAAVAYYPRFVKRPVGIELYQRAAQGLYDNQILRQHEPGFTYPPAFALVMLPFAPMSPGLRNLTWYVVTIASTVCVFRFSEALGSRLLRDRLTEKELAWVRVLTLVLSLKFVLATLENQAYDMLSVAIILAGLLALIAGRELVGGAALAVSAAIKVTPLLFLPYLIVKKRFVAAAAFTVVLVGLSYLPDVFFTPVNSPQGYFHTWVHDIAGQSLAEDSGKGFWGTANPLNLSLRGFVSLNIDETQEPALHKRTLLALDGALIVLAAAMILFRRTAGRELLPLDASILLISMLMLSPMTSKSHYGCIVLPYTLLLMVRLRDPTTRPLGTVVLVASFLLMSVTSNDAVGDAMVEWAAHHSLIVFGALTLLIYLAAIVWNPTVPQANGSGRPADVPGTEMKSAAPST